MKIRNCCNKVMELEVIQDDYDTEDLIFSFTCSVCEDGYAVGWDEITGDKIFIEPGALERLKRASE